MSRVKLPALLGAYLFTMGVLYGLTGASAGCGATSQEPCTEADLGKVVAAHEARLAMKCVGQGPDCPERKAEDARFKEEIRTWVRCDKESEPPR